jgi:hypothetical protein
VENSAPMGLLITNGEFVAMDGENPTMVQIRSGNEGNITFSNCAFWGPCNQNAIIDGRGTTAFADCIFMQWDRYNEGRYAVQANGGSVMISGCNFVANKPQISIGAGVSRAVVTGNMVRGSVRIDNRSANAVIENNLGTL